MPTIEPNVTAIMVATLVCFMLCYAWFTPLFGKVWQKEMGFDAADEPQGSALVKSLVLTLVGIVLMVFVLSNNMAVWQPQTWGITQPNLPIAEQAISAAVFTWLGFVVPVFLNSVAWAKQSWLLFAINTGYYLVALLVSAFILLLV